MTEYKVKSKINLKKMILHEYFKNGKENNSLRVMGRWRGIADFHEQQLKEYPMGYKIETIENTE